MIHLHVGSYVKKPDSVFFCDWPRNNIYGLLSSDKQSNFKGTCGQKLARKPNGADEESFYEDEFVSVLVEAPANFSYNSLKSGCCSGEDVLAVLSAGFLKTTKIIECFRTVYKMNTAIYISSLNYWVTLDLILDIILNLL